MRRLEPRAKEQFLTKRQRYHPIALPNGFSDEELARDWTLTSTDLAPLEPVSLEFPILTLNQRVSNIVRDALLA